MSDYSNINRNNVQNYGNTGAITTGAGGYLEPALIRALVLVPKGTSIPASAMVSQAAFSTYVNAFFVNNDRSLRWFMFSDLDSFKDETKKASSEDTGVLQTMVFKYAPKYSFRYMTGMGNFIEALRFQNWGGDFFWIDQNGSWNGWNDTSTGTGSLNAYTNYQLFVEDMGRTTDKTANQYMFSVQAKNREQYNDNFAYYAANTDFDAIPMLRNVWLSDLSDVLGTPLGITTTTDVVLGATVNEGATDFIQFYQSALTAACFLAFNKTTGLALTISTAVFGLITVAGQDYSYAWLTLSAAPTATNVVRFTLANPSVTEPIILANVVNELPNAANHTF